jgi:AP-3 complex subunit delta-1
MVQLFTFIRADLSNHAPKPTISPDLTNGFSDPSPSTSLDPTFPKSLYLIRPLSSGYELNPVAPSAQKNVPIPPGLDLDVWIIPPMKGDLSGDEHDGELAPEGKVRKLKGKKKEGESGKKSGRRKKQLDVADGGTLTPEEPLEDPVEKERVAYLRTTASYRLTHLNFQRRAERLERLRDDPYYLVDNRAATKRPPPRNTHDIDSIPIVRLDDMPAFPNGTFPPPLLYHSVMSYRCHPSLASFHTTGSETNNTCSHKQKHRNASGSHDTRSDPSSGNVVRKSRRCDYNPIQTFPAVRG